MAYIRKRKGSWQCIVRVHGYPQMTKTFKTKIDAVRFSRDLENKLFRQQHNIDKKKGMIKPYRNDDPSTYPTNQKDNMSMWDMMKESARMDARKGDHTGMRQIKKTLHDDYKKSGGKWMSDEEKKMIGKHTLPEPINLTKINAKTPKKNAKILYLEKILEGVKAIINIRIKPKINLIRWFFAHGFQLLPAAE